MKAWRVPYPKFGEGPGLARVAAAARRLGLDLTRFGEAGAVIVGSNGKGSTASMCAALLQQARGPVGLFTSPHLLDLNERFRVDGEDICDDELARHWARVEGAIAREGLAARIGAFEFLFLIAADWFAARGCAHTVWEAGIGGRLDPVKLIAARRVALTSLDLEHTALLGETLEAIAREKIDAAPEGAALFFTETPIRAEIQSYCAARGVRAYFIAPAPEAPLAGAHQRANAALAIALARDLAPLSDAAVAAGLAATRWPGRLEVLQREPLLVIDVGHTPAGVAAALEGFCALAGDRPATLICGASADKDWGAIIGALAPGFTRIITAAARHKGAPAGEIALAAARANPSAEIAAAESVAEARKLALAGARAGGAIYVAGGLFLAAEARALHLGRDPSSLHFL
ncbi:MAG TPA: cyanophycin synthetase [Terricaulis sp.]|nr:cyanophycin synthetase [Terricaulis sp.]